MNFGGGRVDASMSWLAESFASSLVLARVIGSVDRNQRSIPPLFGQSYYSEFPSVFLSKIRNDRHFRAIPFCLARDGCDYFENRKSAMLDGSSIAAHESVLSGTDFQYRIVPRNHFHRKRKPSSILFALWDHPKFSTLHMFNSELKNFKREFGSEFGRQIPVRIYLEARGVSAAKNSRDLSSAFRLNIRSTLQKYAVDNVEFVTANDLRPYGSSEGICYHEVNSRRLIADTYLQHQVLSQNGGLFCRIPPSKWKAAFRFAQSPYHDIEIGLRV